jgi:hypothetical protein
MCPHDLRAPCQLGTPLIRLPALYFRAETVRLVTMLPPATPPQLSAETVDRPSAVLPAARAARLAAVRRPTAVTTGSAVTVPVVCFAAPSSGSAAPAAGGAVEAAATPAATTKPLPLPRPRPAPRFPARGSAVAAPQAAVARGGCKPDVTLSARRSLATRPVRCGWRTRIV